ncbi:MAG TPA: sulfur oxidation c-type cytochrome SoxX [Xanthobacteraceae bacterium]|nr:sulfur oxidation c-type cytochrome SoxX [Xanthobacteraceae bacterium]
MPGFAPIRERFSVSVAGKALLAAAICLHLSCAAAAPQHTALVPYVIVGDSIPASLTGTKGDPVRGRAIVADQRVGMCLLCHSGPFPENKFQGNIGPDLAGVGGRLSEGQLRLRIVDTSKIDPNTIMPPFYRVEGLSRVPPAYQGKPVLTAVEIEDVVAYLMTLK